MQNVKVTLYNTAKGKEERYATTVRNKTELELSLELFLENGYELVSLELCQAKN